MGAGHGAGDFLAGAPPAPPRGRLRAARDTVNSRRPLPPQMVRAASSPPCFLLLLLLKTIRKTLNMNLYRQKVILPARSFNLKSK